VADVAAGDDAVGVDENPDVGGSAGAGADGVAPAGAGAVDVQDVPTGVVAPGAGLGVDDVDELAVVDG
jgi:hypothetical protein